MPDVIVIAVVWSPIAATDPGGGSPGGTSVWAMPERAQNAPMS